MACGGLKGLGGRAGWSGRAVVAKTQAGVEGGNRVWILYG